MLTYSWALPGNKGASSFGGGASLLTFTDTFSVSQTPIASPWTKNCTLCKTVITTGGIATNNAQNGVTNANDDAIAYVSTSAFLSPSGDYEIVARYAQPGINQMEVEILVRVEDTSSTYSCMEVNLNNGGGELIQINGGIGGNFVEIPGTAYTIAGGCSDGDWITVRVTGTNPVRVQMWHAPSATPASKTQYIDYSDSSGNRKTTGQPGMGFYAAASSGIGNQGWSEFTVTAL